MVKDVLSRSRLARQVAAMLFAGSLALSAGACSDDEDDGSADGTPDGSDGEPSDGSDGEPADGDPSDGSDGSQGGDLYAVMSSIDTDSDDSAYLSLVGELNGQMVDFADAREFAGGADLWVHEGALFVTSAEAQTVTKFTLDGDALVEGDTISFASYGFANSFGFWLNSFVAADKAYMINTTELNAVVWNPRTMEIEREFSIAGDLEAPMGLMVYPGYGDRSWALRGTQLLVPFYYPDSAFASFGPTSSIVVIDTTTDTVTDTLDAGCPGIDFASQDPEGNVYFSAWVFAPGGAALFEQPSTCVAKVPVGDTLSVETTFTVKDATEGREGGVFRYLGDGKGMLSVLHRDNLPASNDFAEVTFGANWRFWSYDLASGEAAVIEAFDFNAGAAYFSQIGEQNYFLVPSGDFASTEILALDADATATSVLKTNGWTLRLFKVR